MLLSDPDIVVKTNHRVVKISYIVVMLSHSVVMISSSLEIPIMQSVTVGVV